MDRLRNNNAGWVCAGIVLLAAAVPSAWAFRAENDAGSQAIGSVTVQGLQAQIPRLRSAVQLEAAVTAERAGLEVVWNQHLATPLSVRGTDLLTVSGLGQQGGRGLAALGAAAGVPPDAISVLGNLASVFGIGDAPSEFAVENEDVDELGYRHVRLEQRCNGLRVVGGGLIVHFGPDGAAREVNGQYVPGVAVEDTPAIGAAEAVRLAQAALRERNVAAGEAEIRPEKVVFARDSDPRLAYEFTLVSRTGDGRIATRWQFWMDALDGSVLLAYNDLKRIAEPTAVGGEAVEITGNRLAREGGEVVAVSGWLQAVGPDDAYYLNNYEFAWRLRNAALTGGYPDIGTFAHRLNSNDWGTSDRAEISAAVNIDIAQRYYQEVHGRSSFDGAGTMALGYIHQLDDLGYDMANAYWDGEAMRIGDGDGLTADNLAVLDVFTHEYTHAVTDYTAKLVYRNESGALNESFSDIFGVCAEFYAQPDDRASYPATHPGMADWLLGEDCSIFYTAARDMRNPANRATVGWGNEQPTLYKGTHWYTGGADNGGVHQNSGVQNFFFYLLCEGGSGVNDTSAYSYNVTGIGITNAEKVAYRALTKYCTTDTSYSSVREAWVSAAGDLNPAWVPSVKHAWNAVLGLQPPLPVTISTASVLPGGWAGSPYQYSLFAVNGVSPYVWEVIADAPPSGISLSSGGVLAGVPIQAETASFTVVATDKTGQTATNQFTLTIQPPFTIPYTQNFDAGTALPDAWSQNFVSNNVAWTFTPGSGIPQGRPAQAYSAPNNARFGINADRLTGSATRLVSPMIDFGATLPYTPALTFWHCMAQWGDSRDKLRVYYRTAPDAEWVLLQAFSANTGAWTQRNIPLPETSRTFYIAFEGIAEYGYGVHIDDVWIGDFTAPLALQLPVNGLPEAIIDQPYSYALEATGGRSPYTFTLVSGSLPTGLTLDADGTLGGVGTVAMEDVPCTVQVTDDAGVSIVADLLLSVVPARATLFAEDFESGSFFWHGWTQVAVTNSVSWSVQAGGGNANSILTPRYPHSGSYNATLYWWGTGLERPDHITRLVSPQINLGAAPSDIRLTFWHCMPELQGDQDSLRVYGKPSENSAWTLLAAYSNDVPAWTRRTFMLPNPSSTYYIAFEGNARFGGGVSLDDIRITQNAPAPVFITPNPLPDASVWISYTTQLTAAGGVAPYVFGWVSGMLPPGVTLADDGTLSGLPTAGGTFMFRVSVTGADGESTTQVYRLTVRAGQSLPFVETFEDGPTIPDGWTQESSTSVSWKFRSGSEAGHPSSAHTGAVNANLYDTTPGGHTKRKLVTPMLNLVQRVENPRLTFWLHMQKYGNDQDNLRLYYKTSPTNTWTLLATYTNDVSAWTECTLPLPDPSDMYMLAFEGDVGWGWGVCVDDVSVTGDAVASGLDNWKEEHFGDDAGDEEIAGDDADPDGDGILNIWEYISGTDPNVSNAGDREAYLDIAVVDGEKVVSFPFGKLAEENGVTWELWSSTNLIQDWTFLGPIGVRLHDTDEDRNTWWRIIYAVDPPAAEAPTRFFKLKATVP